jgi:hypothetical protein
MSRSRSKLISGSEDEQSEEHHAVTGSRSFGSQKESTRYPSAPPESSPILKLSSVVAGVAFLLKLFVIQQFFATSWAQTPFLVVDQIVGLLMVGLVIALCVMPKN